MVWNEPLGKAGLTAPALAVIEKNWRERHPGVDRLTVKDTNVAGLELRLTKAGSRSWAVSMRVRGVQRRFTLPDSSRLGLAEARREAEAIRDQVRQGGDPVVERREARAAAAEEPKSEITLRDVLDEFAKAVAIPKRQRSWNIRRKHIEVEYKAHLTKPAAELTTADVRRVLDAAVARGARVSGWHGFRYLKRIMSWAARRGLVPMDPTTGIPREEVADTVGREKPRDQVLSAAELRAIWQELEARAGDAYTDTYRLILLTAQRPSEVSTMCWADLDLDRAEWTQATNKSDRRHVVPLSRAALAVLKVRKKALFGDKTPTGYVLPSRTGRELDNRTGNWARFTGQISEKAAVQGWHRHDLRRTAATLMAEMKVDHMVIELLLNHSERQAKGGLMTEMNNRRSYAMEMRQAIEGLADRIDRIAAGAEAEIAQLRAGWRPPGAAWH